MVERYKVLGAMLALREFTVADVARFTGVKGPTVQTVLDRQRQFIERVNTVDAQQSRKRGGQCVYYRIKPDQVDTIRSKIETLFRELGRVSRGRFSRRWVAEVPNGLLAAEDSLIRVFPKAATPEKKREVLRLAQISIHGGRLEAQGVVVADPDFRKILGAHERCVDALEALCESELAAEVGQQVVLPIAQKVILQIAADFFQVGDGDTALAWLKRVEASSVWNDAVERRTNKREHVVLIDLIRDPEQDTLKQYVTDVLHKNHIPCLPHPNQSVTAGSRYVCVFLTDSSKSEAVSVLRPILKSWTSAGPPCSEHDELFVLDASFDPKMRNDIFTNGFQYIGLSNSVDPHALLGALKLRPDPRPADVGGTSGEPSKEITAAAKGTTTIIPPKGGREKATARGA